MRRTRCRHAIVVGALAAGLCFPGAHAQNASSPAAPAAQTPGTGSARPERRAQRAQFAGMQHVMGEVTAVNGNTLTLKGENGATVSVVTTENTRLREDRGTIRVTDLRPGDGLMALGNLDPNAPVLHAAMVFAQTAAEIKTMRDNLGKTYITGRVTAVNLDDARMTVERPDHVAQTIGFDETTSFKRGVRGGGGGSGGPGGSGSGGDGNGEPGDGASPGPDPGAQPGGADRGPGGSGFGGGGMGMGGMALGGGIDRAFATGESITLSDIRVGDSVAGTGSVKNGTFVPTRLVDSPPRSHRPRPGAGTGTGTGTGAGSATSSSPGPAAR